VCVCLYVCVCMCMCVCACVCVCTCVCACVCMLVEVQFINFCNRWLLLGSKRPRQPRRRSGACGGMGGSERERERERQLVQRLRIVATLSLSSAQGNGTDGKTLAGRSASLFRFLGCAGRGRGFGCRAGETRSECPLSPPPPTPSSSHECIAKYPAPTLPATTSTPSDLAPFTRRRTGGRGGGEWEGAGGTAPCCDKWSSISLCRPQLDQLC